MTECDGKVITECCGYIDGICRCMTCGRCQQQTGNNNQGHYWKYCKVTRQLEEFHFAAPGIVNYRMKKRRSNRSIQDTRFAPPAVRKGLVHINDLVKNKHTCFHCGEPCTIQNGIIKAHPNRYWELCWASNRSLPLSTNRRK